MENRIDQIFKEKLENFEKNPPVGLLEQINQQIAFRSRVRRINQIKTVIGMAAALVLALMAGWYALDNNEFADNKIPAQIRQNENIQQSVPANTIVATTPGVNKLVAQPRNKAEIVANKPTKPVNKNQGQRQLVAANSATNSNHANDNNAHAVQTTSNETNKTTAQEKSSSGSKVDQPSDQKSTTRQKNAEPLYFADSFNPATDRNKKSVKGSWEIKAELSPMFASQGQVANSSTKSMSTMSGGMMASYRLNNKLSISTGVRFAQMKQGTHTDYFLSAKSGITYLEPVEKSANIARDVSLYLPSTSSIVYSNGMQSATASNIFKSDVSQDFKYLEIPVQATYKLIDNAFSVGVTGGISTNLLIGNIASITENGIKLSQGSTDNLRDVIYSGSAGIELGYGLGKNLILTVEPRIKQYMHSVSSNDLINFKPLQMGIFTGITYTFN